MPNGCMCCRVRGDLVAALKRLVSSAAGIAIPEQTNLGSPTTGVGTQEEGSEQAADSAKSTDNVDAVSAPMAKAIKNPVALDGVVLECSGLDELAPVLQVRRNLSKYDKR